MKEEGAGKGWAEWLFSGICSLMEEKSPAGESRPESDNSSRSMTANFFPDRSLYISVVRLDHGQRRGRG